MEVYRLLLLLLLTATPVVYSEGVFRRWKIFTADWQHTMAPISRVFDSRLIRAGHPQITVGGGRSLFYTDIREIIRDICVCSMRLLWHFLPQQITIRSRGENGSVITKTVQVFGKSSDDNRNVMRNSTLCRCMTQNSGSDENI